MSTAILLVASNSLDFTYPGNIEARHYSECSNDLHPGIYASSLSSVCWAMHMDPSSIVEHRCMLLRQVDDEVATNISRIAGNNDTSANKAIWMAAKFGNRRGNGFSLVRRARCRQQGQCR